MDEQLEPLWICMACKTVIGPVVDDGENKCRCKDQQYDIELWRIEPVGQTAKRLAACEALLTQAHGVLSLSDHADTLKLANLIFSYLKEAHE